MPEAKHPDCHPLVVDDDPQYFRLLQRCFERVGIPRQQIRSAADGDEAIEVLAQEGGMTSFVLLDLNMPRRSGLEVLEWIRSASPPLSQIPVFMLTSDSDPRNVARAFELGVGSYFIKPMELRDLEGVLEGVVAYWKGLQRCALLRGSVPPPGR